MPFRGVERLENLVHLLAAYASADVRNRNPDAVGGVTCAYSQRPNSALDRGHRRDRIDRQIEDDLLQLYVVSGNRRRRLSERGFDRDLVVPQLAVDQGQDIENQLVHIDRLPIL